MNEQLMVSGTVTRATYESLKKYIVPTAVKYGSIAVIILYDIWMVYQMCVSDFLPNLLMAAAFTALMVFMFFHTRSSVVKRAVESQKAIKSGEGIKLTIHFDEHGIRMYNHTMGRERNLAYGDFVSYADTSKCLALFVKKGNYLMVPKDEMDDALYDQLMALIKRKIPKLRKRL